MKSIGCAKECAKVLEHHSQEEEVKVEHENIEHEGGDLSDSDIAILVDFATDIDSTDHRSVQHHHCDSNEASRGNRLLCSGLEDLYITFSETFQLGFLTCEGFHSSHVG